MRDKLNFQYECANSIRIVRHRIKICRNGYFSFAVKCVDADCEWAGPALLRRRNAACDVLIMAAEPQIIA